MFKQGEFRNVRGRHTHCKVVSAMNSILVFLVAGILFLDVSLGNEKQNPKSLTGGGLGHFLDLPDGAMVEVNESIFRRRLGNNVIQEVTEKLDVIDVTSFSPMARRFLLLSALGWELTEHVNQNTEHEKHEVFPVILIPTYKYFEVVGRKNRKQARAAYLQMLEIMGMTQGEDLEIPFELRYRVFVNYGKQILKNWDSLYGGGLAVFGVAAVTAGDLKVAALGFVIGVIAKAGWDLAHFTEFHPLRSITKTRNLCRSLGSI